MIANLHWIAEERLEQEWESRQQLSSVVDIREESELFETITQEAIDTFYAQLANGERCRICGRHESVITEGFAGDLCIDKCAID